MQKIIFGAIGVVIGIFLGIFLNHQFPNMNFHMIMPVLGLMMGWDYGKRKMEGE